MERLSDAIALRECAPLEVDPEALEALLAGFIERYIGEGALFAAPQ